MNCAHIRVVSLYPGDREKDKKARTVSTAALEIVQRATNNPRDSGTVDAFTHDLEEGWESKYTSWIYSCLYRRDLPADPREPQLVDTVPAGRYVEIDQLLENGEALNRIETFVFAHITGVLTDHLMTMLRALVFRCSSGLKSAVFEEVEGVFAYRVPDTGRHKNIKFRDARTRNPFMRFWMIVNSVHESLTYGRKLLLRGLYYTMHADNIHLFPNSLMLYRCLLDVVGLLRCDRRSLNIITDSRGSVWGEFEISEGEGEVRNWRTYDGTYDDALHITGDVGKIRNGMHLRNINAAIVLITEKFAVAFRLMQELAALGLVAIIVTGRGMPDLATRALLRKFKEAKPGLKIYALMVRDWCCLI